MASQEAKVAAKKGTPNRRWELTASMTLIEFLAEQARSGYKPDKNFKKPSLVAAAQHINNKFDSSFTCHNVENHIRTLKGWYKEISNILALSGAGWNDATKRISLEPETAKAYLQEHPTARPFIENPIPYYDDLRLVCGDDQAIGSYGKSSFELFGHSGERVIDEEFVRIDDVVIEDGIDVTSDNHARPSATSQSSKKRPADCSTSKARARREKRHNEEDAPIIELISYVREVADSLKVISCVSIDWQIKLHDAVFAFDGEYPSEMLEQAYLYLDKKGEAQMKCFVLKKEEQKRKWLDNFMMTNYVEGVDASN